METSRAASTIWAADLGRKKLFVAELGNNSFGVVDVQEHRLETRLAGLDEPQKVGFVPGVDTLFIANGGNGAINRRGLPAPIDELTY